MLKVDQKVPLLKVDQKVPSFLQVKPRKSCAGLLSQMILMNECMPNILQIPRPYIFKRFLI